MIPSLYLYHQTLSSLKLGCKDHWHYLMFAAVLAHSFQEPHLKIVSSPMRANWSALQTLHFYGLANDLMLTTVEAFAVAFYSNWLCLGRIFP